MSLRPHPYHTYSLRARRRAADIETPRARSRSLSREASLSSDLPQVWEAFNFGRPHLRQEPLESPTAGGSSSKAGPSSTRTQLPASLPPPPGDLPQPPRYTKGEVLMDLDAVVVAQHEQVRPLIMFPSFMLLIDSRGLHCLNQVTRKRNGQVSSPFRRIRSKQSRNRRIRKRRRMRW